MLLLSSKPADVRPRSRQAYARQGCCWSTQSHAFRAPRRFIVRCIKAGSIPDDLHLEFQLEALKPAIILVEPRMGENIGAAARAMKNFGLCDLRLVKPQDGWPNPLADVTASHAVDLIRSARLYDTVTDAVADLDRVYAATARTRFMSKAFVTSRQLPTDLRQLAAVATEAAVAAADAAEAAAAAADAIPPPLHPSAALSARLQASSGTAASSGPPTPELLECQPDHLGPEADLTGGREPGVDPSSRGPPPRAAAAAWRQRWPRAGVMFGRESSGLTNEEVAAAHKVLTIEANPDYPVLNLAQAVVCTAYELHHARLDVAGTAVGGAGTTAPTTATAAATASAGNVLTRTTSDCSAGNPSSSSSSASSSSSSSSSPAVSSSAEELRIRAAALQLASRGEVEAFLERLVSELDAAGFFASADKRPATLLSIRNLAAKVDRMTAAEVALLHGMVSKLVGVGARAGRAGGRRRQPQEGQTEGQGPDGGLLRDTAEAGAQGRSGTGRAE